MSCFPLSFKLNHYINHQKDRRNRKLLIPNLTLALIHLVAAPKAIGYLCALTKSWTDFGLDLNDLPTKSSLSEARTQISSEYFKDSLFEQVKKIKSRLSVIRGLRLYAIDGDQLELPASHDVLKNEYKGYRCKNNIETHYPRLYYTAKVDVLSGVVVDIEHSNTNDECRHSLEMAKRTESQSLSLYDRLFFSLDLAHAHEESKSYYIARLKQGPKVLLELQNFIASGKTSKRSAIDGIFIRFIKVKNPKTKELMYLATNLPRSFFKINEIQKLYWRRYDSECVFRDLTSTHSLGIWHSTKINGILQEFYLHFYIHNATRFFCLNSDLDTDSFLKTNCYHKPCFKLIRCFFIDNIKLFISKKLDQFKNSIQILIKKSSELRRYFQRSAPRHVKFSRNTYPSASLVVRRS